MIIVSSLDSFTPETNTSLSMEPISTPRLPALCATCEEFLKHDYSLVVVGCGTAGLIAAARLSENLSIHVGVLEADPPDIRDPVTIIPAQAIKQMDNLQHD